MYKERNFATKFFTLCILTSILVYFIVILLWSYCKNLILISPFVLQLLQINHGSFNRIPLQNETTNSDPVFVVGRCIGGHNSSETLNIIRKQPQIECLQINSKIQKWWNTKTRSLLVVRL